VGANLRSTRLDKRRDHGSDPLRPAEHGMRVSTKRLYAACCNGQPTVRTWTRSIRRRAVELPEIELVVTYLRVRVIGKRAVTPEECAYYYGDWPTRFATRKNEADHPVTDESNCPASLRP